MTTTVPPIIQAREQFPVGARCTGPYHGQPGKPGKVWQHLRNGLAIVKFDGVTYPQEVRITALRPEVEA